MNTLAFASFVALAVTAIEARPLPESAQAFVSPTSATAAKDTVTTTYKWDRCGIIVINPWCR